MYKLFSSGNFIHLFGIITLRRNALSIINQKYGNHHLSLDYVTMRTPNLQSLHRITLTVSKTVISTL